MPGCVDFLRDSFLFRKADGKRLVCLALARAVRKQRASPLLRRPVRSDGTLHGPKRTHHVPCEATFVSESRDLTAVQPGTSFKRQLATRKETQKASGKNWQLKLAFASGSYVLTSVVSPSFRRKHRKSFAQPAEFPKASQHHFFAFYEPVCIFVLTFETSMMAA